MFNDRRTEASYEIANIFSQYEIKLLAMRKDLFERVIGENIEFRNGVYKEAKHYEMICDSEAYKAFRAITAVVNSEYDKTYTESMRSIDAPIRKDDDILKTTDKTKAILQKMTIATISTMASIFFGAKQEALKQLMTVANNIVGRGDEVRQQIAVVSADIVRQGLVVDTQSGGGKKNIVSQGEFVFRNEAEKVGKTVVGAVAMDNGYPYARISGHPSSCPLCVPWQNKLVINDVFADAMPDGKTPLMSTAIAEGLFHFNCRHDYAIAVEGKDRADIYKKDTASPRETAMRYAVEEKQRYNERNIREWRRREVSALTNEERSNAEFKVREWQQKQHLLRKVAKENGVPFYRQYEREYEGGKTEPQIRDSIIEIKKHLW